MIANHVSSRLPKTPINRDPPQFFGGFTHIQKSRNSVGIKLQSLQELQPSNLNHIQREIIQVIFLDLKLQVSIKIYGFKSPKPRRTSTTIFKDEEHTKNIQRIHEEREE